MEKTDGKKRTEIGELGEFGLIGHLTKNIQLRQATTLHGVGDDAAVIDAGEGKVKIVTTDMMVEGVHFDLMYHPLRHLGYKAVVSNLSDICAMNGAAQQITVSIAVSNRFSVEALEELYEGIIAACDKYEVDLVGGDTTSSPKGMVISITAIGEATKERVVYRNGAKAGDIICVSGDLGAAYMGLQLLEREKQLYLENPEIQPDLEGEKYVIGRQLMPEARTDILEILEELKIKPTAMIDISDGLSSDILHICNRSGVGCRLEEGYIPIAKETGERAQKFNIAPVVTALNGGEDYELLFTIPPGEEPKLEGNTLITVIGRTTKPGDGFKLHTKGGSLVDLKAQGWNSFSGEA